MMKWLELLSKHKVVLIIVFCLVNQISANNGIEINFLNKVSQSQKTQIIAIAHQNTHSLSKALQSIEWIETFEIQKTIFGKTLLQISAKIPLLVLNDTFFVDKSMNFYKVHEFEDDLLRVNCPEYLFKDIFSLINNVQEILNFSLKTINYDVIEGWHLFSHSMQIKLGHSPSFDELETLTKTMEYLYSNRKFPSIIDLRSSSGVAIQYVQ